MRTMWSTILKELLELRRDRAGLMVLLAMPVALVLIVSIVQDNVMQATGETPIRVLFVDQDGGALGRSISAQIRAARGLDLVQTIDGVAATEESARRAVGRGDFQFCILIAPGTSSALRARVEEQASTAVVGMIGAATKPPDPSSPAPMVRGLTLLVDPAVQGSLRTAVVSSLQRIVMGIEVREKATVLTEALPKKVDAVIKGLVAPGPQGTGLRPGFRFVIDAEPVLDLAEENAAGGRWKTRPTAAQQNVPAWALFGMFFIVVPLSGTIIRERETGTFRRLMTLPISPAGLLAGKVCAYALVCLAQLALMMGIGWLVLPLLGTSRFAVPAAQWPAVAVIGAAAALAATGYGIMIGTLARSHEQASMFGAVSIVIAAALGGIMVPAYVMPRYMQAVSEYSPLAWGLNAFQDVIVRGESLRSAWAGLSLLTAFAVATLSIASLSLRRIRSAE
jgi:ABC-2 type transport system permease protein